MLIGTPANACTCIGLTLGEEAVDDATLIEHLDGARVQTP